MLQKALNQLQARFRSNLALKKRGLLKSTLLHHVIFWMLYFIFNVLRWGAYFDDFHYSFQSNLVEFSIHIALVYFNLYYLLPRLFPEKLVKYVSILMASVFVLSAIRILLTYQLVTTEIWKEVHVDDLNLFDPNYFLAVFIGEIYVLGFTTSIKFGIDYISSVRKTKELENKKMEAELSFLRSQIQPHFFFNTLNNLYALSLIKSPKAPETILKLSELMSYVIYEGKAKRVALSKEIKHIHDYLELEKLRYSEKLEANIEIRGSIENYFMPPLILTPFIENCFKHGKAEGQIPIIIHIEVQNQRLSYTVRNEIVRHQTKRKKTNGRRGIGLRNVKKRLNLLFKTDFDISFRQEEDFFTVILDMPLYDKMLDR